MQIKLLNDIVIETAGKQAGEIVKMLFGKKDVNEFLVAKKLKLTINQVRNIFYKLSNFGLVSFMRKKDRRKGWYTYFWTLNTEKALELLEKRLEKEVENLRQQLKSRETKRFYVCKTCKREVSEENALQHEFTCQECGEVYHLNEDEKILADLKNEISKIEKYKVGLSEELGKIRVEKGKKQMKLRKKLEKKTKKDRQNKRAKNKMLAKKNKQVKKPKSKKIRKKKKK
ncbi:MAG: hypothetical protein NT076_01550 [Candidatus Pacearchaeota archaeon]|nr:hypothetical protein [Candidatus Pacearchaeota archaeon]